MKSVYDFPEGSRYYDEGWNDACTKQPRKSPCTEDYLEGYKDCLDAPEEDRIEIE